MTIYKLINTHLNKHPDSHFFDNDTLKFFGEARSRMKVLKTTRVITDVCGEKHTCYVVSSVRTKNWQGSCKPYTKHHYFDVNTLEDVII